MKKGKKEKKIALRGDRSGRTIKGRRSAQPPPRPRYQGRAHPQGRRGKLNITCPSEDVCPSPPRSRAQGGDNRGVTSGTRSRRPRLRPRGNKGLGDSACGRAGGEWKIKLWVGGCDSLSVEASFLTTIH